MLNGHASKKFSTRAGASGILLAAIALLIPTQTTAQTTNSAGDSEMVTIQFEGMVGDEPFSCGDTYRLGTEGSAVTPLDFRLYVSEVALVDAAGNAVPLVLEQDNLWQHQNVALLDFEDKTGGCTNGTSDTRAQVIGAVPAGDYTGLQFTVGVPFALNHIDSTLAPSPLNLTSLWWTWNFGYKFARIDFQPVIETARSVPKSGNHGTEAADSETAPQAFSIHLGSVGCQMDAGQAPVNCSLAHRPDVVLSDFDVTQNVVAIDIAALLADTNMSQNQEGTPVGCMSNPADEDCRGILQNFGLPFRELPAEEQSVFSIQ